MDIDFVSLVADLSDPELDTLINAATAEQARRDRLEEIAFLENRLRQATAQRDWTVAYNIRFQLKELEA